MSKKYSSYMWAIDLVMEEHKITNPIDIAEKIKDDLDMEVSIHQIIDYLDINNKDWQKMSEKLKYYQY